MQTNGCRVLGSLAYRDGPAVVGAGAFTPIVTAMKQFPKCEELQTNGCCALKLAPRGKARNKHR